MKIKQKLIIAIITSLVLSLCTQSFANQKPNCKAGELLVKFKPGNEKKAFSAIGTIGAKVIQKLSQISVSRIKLKTGMSVAQAQNQLSKLPFFEFIEPNYINLPDWKPSDPKWDAQWGIAKIKTALVPVAFL